jgi:hypothetical protein
MNMRTKMHWAAACAAALSLTLSPVSMARAAAPDGATQASATDLSSAKRKKRPRVVRPRGGTSPIACLRGGCQHIPPGCEVVTEFDMEGLPTGFDTYICPFR